MNELRYDLYRITGRTDTKTLIKTIIFNKTYRKIAYFRKYQTMGIVGKQVIRFLNHFLSNKMTIDLPFSTKIGKGLLILHPYAIVFNSQCALGENCTIMKGATIANSKTGKIGAPIIGDNVYIGLNSSIVGGVSVGNNVLIAANTFVNFDVPDNSIVVGSPGVIHHKINASEPYTTNSIFDIEGDAN